MQLHGSAQGACFLLRASGPGHVPACLLACTTPCRALFHDLAASLLALLGAAAASLRASLVRVRSERAGAGRQDRGKNAECLAIHGQFVCLGMMLPVFISPALQVLETMMGRLVARPDTRSQDLQVLVVEVALLFVLLRLDIAAAGHEQSGRACSYPAQEFSTVHDHLLLHENKCDVGGRRAGPRRNSNAAEQASNWCANGIGTIDEDRPAGNSGLGSAGHFEAWGPGRCPALRGRVMMRFA